ncbi:hypothetical protein PC123_g24089 [Phytophthora cactorum]|nr:hypothetical protein PC123_g24089 [Phytophthora cactorum]
MDNTLKLSAEHKLARREYAREWILYTKDVWPRVVFSDEKHGTSTGHMDTSDAGKTCASGSVRRYVARMVVAPSWCGVVWV